MARRTDEGDTRPIYRSSRIAGIVIFGSLLLSCLALMIFTDIPSESLGRRGTPGWVVLGLGMLVSLACLSLAAFGRARRDPPDITTWFQRRDGK